MTDDATRATTFALLPFVGLACGMVVQSVAGAWRDRLRPRWGRRGAIGLGVLFVLASPAVFGAASSLLVVLVAYLLIQVAASVAQAAQQGFSTCSGALARPASLG